ncbi:MAG: hypothetical protein [Caudoviricetes sp.]|nr:MAG: hypothetical protein [Caudoviricetes sp.]
MGSFSSDSIFDISGCGMPSFRASARCPPSSSTRSARRCRISETGNAFAGMVIPHTPAQERQPWPAICRPWRSAIVQALGNRRRG